MNLFKYVFIFLFTLPFVLQAQQSVQVNTPPIALTDGTTYLMAPKWAPQTGTLAATSTNYRGIYLITFPEGEITKISDHPAAGFGMEWSHSGDHIATTIAKFQDKRRYNALLLIDPITGDESRLSDFHTLFPGTPEWSMDDKYVYLKGTDEFKLYNIQSKERVQISTESVPSQEVVDSKKGELRLRDNSDRTEQKIQPVEGQVLNLALSPDGTKMAFEIMGGHLWVANVDGSSPVDLGIGNRPTWGPNSDKIVYMVTEDDGHEFTEADIYAVNADGSGKVNLTETPDILEMYPTWSPDGNWIAYSTLGDGKIFIQEVQ